MSANECRCIPVATIFPPATLSVANVPGTITSMLKVPQYDFTTLDFVAPMESTDGVTNWTTLGETTETSLWAWSGPSQPLQNIATAVMALGQILPISPPAPNASWSLNFWGPLLQCSDVLGNERDQIWTNIWNSYNFDGIGSYAFMSWAPWPALLIRDIDEISGQSSNASNRDLPFQYGNGYSSSPWQFSTGGPASLFVAVQPKAQRLQITTPRNSTSNAFGYDWPTGWDYCSIPTIRTLNNTITMHCGQNNISFTPSLMYDDSTLLRCDLLNSSYSMNMTYLNGVQDIQVSTNTTGISPLVIGSDYFIGPKHWPLSESSNCSSFLVNPYSDSLGDPTPCVFDVSAMRLLSYQGIMTAFSQLILGDIRIHDGSHVKRNTTIVKTVLAQTDELAFLRDLHPALDSTQEYLQTTISNRSRDLYPGLLDTSLPRTLADLKVALEQLFLNLTVSLLSEPYFK